MNRPIDKFWFGLVALAISAGGIVAQEGGEPAGAAEAGGQGSLTELPLAMESRPYRVRILVARDSDADPSLLRDVEQSLARSVGGLWQTDIEDLAGVVLRDAAVLGRWSVDDVRQRFADDEVEFWFAATVHDRGSQRTISVRAWQPKFEWLSPVHEESFFEPRETAARLVKLCWGLFRPQVVIEHVDQNAVRLRIPAGDLQPADPEYVLFRPGDCLIPWLLYYDRDKKLQRRQELPWTYVKLDELRGPLASGTVLSGLRMPLAGKMRGRIEKVAVASRATYPQSTLQLGVQNQPARRLAGYRLELRPKLPERAADENAKEKAAAAPKADEGVRQLLTNRLGEVIVTPAPEQPQVWIFVYSGELLLARVPFVPGSLPFLRLEVPDDSVRLQVEGELQVLQNELINLVAERNTLIAGARGASKKGDWQRVASLRKQLDTLPQKQSFHERLAGIRVPAVNAAKSRKDRNAQVRIERLCKDAGELIDRYLDPEKLQLIKDELDQLAKDAKLEPVN